MKNQAFPQNLQIGELESNNQKDFKIRENDKKGSEIRESVN